jgi:predicted lipid-binding transport protein (Tim44 family)
LIASAALPALQAPKSLCALLPRLSQAVHPAAAARLAEQPASSSSSGSAAEQQTQQPQQQPVQGATESVVFSSIAKAAAEANKRPASGVPGVTKFLGFTGEGGWLGQLLQLLQHWRTLCVRAC